ncbi:MAG: nicotinamide-nucleotide adenylyltransferase [Candidatus Hodarchaeota archaeon]
MKNEILACIDDENIKYLQSGQISKYIYPIERKQAHEKHISHLITRFFIISKSPKGEIKYLVQKRSKSKSSYPGYFTDSSSGHIQWQKNLDLVKIKNDALRELEEEFGIPSKAIRNVRFYELNDEQDDKTKEIAYVFFGLVDYGIPLNPDPDELDIEQSKFYTKNELDNLLKNEKSVDHSRKIWRIILNTDLNLLFGDESELNLSQNNDIALFIGRFQPLHHGHIYVLQTILKSYKKVKIGIGSSQLSNTINDPFTNIERKEFLNAAFKKRSISSSRYQIFYIVDIFDANKWVDHVVSIIGEFNTVFSNSDWIRALFHNKGYKVEKKVEIFKKKFNGNNIRRLILKNDKSWTPLVPKEVRELIEKFDGINRLKYLSNTAENS